MKEPNFIHTYVNSASDMKPKKRIGAYDGRFNNPAQHLSREGWVKNFQYNYPEDVGLGINLSINKQDISVYQEIFHRFLILGYINSYSTSCVLIASVLRRILRLHGIPAHMKQVICYWENETKGYKSSIGVSDQRGTPITTEKGTIDSHVVVSSNGYILDFGQGSIHQQFGLLAPRASIGLDVLSDEYQDMGLSGLVAWTDVKPENPLIRHWRLEQKSLELEMVQEYFRHYQF